jgi:hypothetical protein
MRDSRTRAGTRATKEGRAHDRSDTNYQQSSCIEHVLGSKDGPDHQMPSLGHHERRGCKRLNPESQQMGEDSKRHHRHQVSFVKRVRFAFLAIATLLL